MNGIIFSYYFSIVIVTETCGSFEASCESVSVLSTALIATTIIGLICFCILFLICCLRSCRRQRIHTIYTNSSGQIVAGPYQQYPDRGSVRVVHVRSVYNVGSSPPYRQYPGLYEEAPPSYESAIANLPTVHQSSTPTV